MPRRRSSRSRSRSRSKSKSKSRSRSSRSRSRRSRDRRSRRNSRSRSKSESRKDEKVKEENKEEDGKKTRKSRWSSAPTPATPPVTPALLALSGAEGDTIKTEGEGASTTEGAEGAENPDGTKRKRKTRWDPVVTSEASRGFTVVAAEHFEKKRDEQELFLIRMRLQYLNKLLGDNGPFDKELAGESPEPVYDAKGNRTNTREQRAIAKIKKEQSDLVAKAVTLTSKLKGVDILPFRQKLEASIDLPVKEFPDYNFKGLVIGPRGVNQRRLEQETGCKIAVRGIGMGRRINGVVTPGEGDDLPLHVLITALDGDQATLDRGINKIKELLKAPPGPEERAKQLRELAMYNGTFREALKCHNCGDEGHKLYNCPKKEKPTWTPFNVACIYCGANTHVAIDCPLKLGDPKARSLHKEYDQFMSEIDSTGGSASEGGGGPSGGGQSRAGIGFVPPGGGAASSGGLNASAGGAAPLRFPHLHPLDIRNGPSWVPGPGDPIPSNPSARPPGGNPGAKPGEAPWMRPPMTGMPPGFPMMPMTGMMGARPPQGPMGMVPMMPMGARPPGNALLMPPRPPGPSFAPFLRPPLAPTPFLPPQSTQPPGQAPAQSSPQPPQSNDAPNNAQNPNPYQPYQQYSPQAFPPNFSPNGQNPYFSQPRPPMLSPFPQALPPMQGQQLQGQQLQGQQLQGQQLQGQQLQGQQQQQQQQPQQFEYYSQ